MAEIYYCKNEEDFKRVVIHIFKNDNYEPEECIELSKICACKYKPEETESCHECDLDMCLLYEHLNDKDVRKQIVVPDDIPYPCIICITESDFLDERVTICSVEEAKNNTKY